MIRLDKDKKNLLVYKIKGGVSINKISSSLNLAKSTIYHHYKKIKGKKYKEPMYKIEFSEDEGEIVGIFTGDGSQCYYRPNGNYQTNVHFGNNPKYIKYVRKLYENYFNKKWSIHKEITKEKSIKYRLRAENKKTFDFFSNYLEYEPKSKHNTVKLKTIKLPYLFKIGFIRGLIDTDGTIGCYNNRVEIRFYTTSKILAKQTKTILKDLKINTSVYVTKRKNWKDLYNVQILQKDTVNFLKLIKPYKMRKILGP